MVAEWLIATALKAVKPMNGFEGSNPSHSVSPVDR